MFDIAFSELAMTGLVALLVLGPDKLPGAARTAGLWMGKARRMMHNVKAEVERELRVDELRQNILKNNPVDDLNNLVHQTREELDNFRQEVSSVGQNASDAGASSSADAAKTPTPSAATELPPASDAKPAPEHEAANKTQP